ncbi:hypothetical protein TNCV_1726631 [Trichonephila clavipes]|nr:hypothetical protein TNCV_1726631 [Trichonephila clavipes]
MKEGCGWQNGMKFSLLTSQAFVCNITMVGFESGDTVTDVAEQLRYAPLHWSCTVYHGMGSDEAHFWLNGYVNKQNCRIWSAANAQEYVETPLHPEKLTVWCALWAGGILLQKR